MKQESALQGKISEHILSTQKDMLSTPIADSSENFAAKSKTSANYWAKGNQRLFKHSRQNAKGKLVKDADYSCQIAFGGHRERFQLHTANKAEGANKAATIYRDIVGKGWDAAKAIHKPKAAAKVDSLPNATVGGLIEACMRLSKARRASMDSYAKALRRITAGVFGISDGKKFDAFQGGRAAWLKRIDARPLAELTPLKVQAWQNRYMKEARTPEGRLQAGVTVNSLVRNAKALLSQRKKNNVRKLIEAEMILPSPLFFEDVVPEDEPVPTYQSKKAMPSGGVESILRNAQTELAVQNPEAFKLLLLTLPCGLRRSEADTLLWRQFDFDARVLELMDTEHKQLKSKGSAGSIDLDLELCTLFKVFMDKSQGDFVLEKPKRFRVATMQDRKTRGYRCEQTHQSLLKWLRNQGVKGLRPIHTMRKEIGSIIASRDGIWKASRYLRHSGIQITSKLYADKKEPVTAGFGTYFAPAIDSELTAQSERGHARAAKKPKLGKAR